MKSCTVKFSVSIYLMDPANLFMISSDFCHWGKQSSFDQLKFFKSCHVAMQRADLDKHTHLSIENLDKMVIF